MQRHARFLYVDRIVVAVGTQARGAGTRLYRDVYALASRDAVPLITCEFDIEPPNPASERFHARPGFCEVGRQQLDGGSKTVSLQALDVAAGNTPLGKLGREERFILPACCASSVRLSGIGLPAVRGQLRRMIFAAHFLENSTTWSFRMDWHDDCSTDSTGQLANHGDTS